MLIANEKYTGTSYTGTVMLLVMAFIFIPAILIASRPFGYLSISVAIVCSVICTALAWVNWKRSSRLCISSITDQGAKKN